MWRVTLRIAGQLASEMVAPSLNGIGRAKASGAIGDTNGGDDHEDHNAWDRSGNSSFATCRVNTHSKFALTKSCERAHLPTFFAHRKSCLIGREACGGSN